ncbi:MAG: M61 family metallopeptidase [Burkholderiaceae bacterium]|nr:M61 family metallopeptidase [Burkholderiaceae bacterium]
MAGRAQGAAALHYRVEIGSTHEHLLHASLRIDHPQAVTELSLPVWIPGSYLVREFSRHLQRLVARQGRHELTVEQIDKARWRVQADPSKPLELSWEVYAFDNSVRTAWLDESRCFFNPTSVCLRVEGQQGGLHAIELPPPRLPRGTPRWELATGLTPVSVDSRGFGSYVAQDYDELADCPVEMGAFWSGRFKAGGVNHRFVVAGAPASFDGERLLRDTRRICEAQIRFWHGSRRPPFKSYVFLLNAVNDGYGGLEHRNSTALICDRRDLPRLGDARSTDGYTTLLGLVSHEYFHTWSVKRLRPAEFERYRYDAENYSQLLWFFEGFTSYYDDLFLRRTGLIDDATYLRLLCKTANQVLQTPGRFVQSVAQASFDAWVKYYRQDENTPNATVSYYTKGALVGLAFDLTLRAEGRGTLDDVMRGLWQRCAAGPMTEADFAAVLEDVGGRAFTREIAAWVHGTDELPLRPLLEKHGAQVHDDPAQMAQALGLRVTEGQAVQVKMVLSGGAGQQAGLAAGDEWLGIELPARRGAEPQGWRIGRLDDIALYAGTAARRITAVVARDKRLLRLPLELPQGATTWRLSARDAKALGGWLD